MRQVYGLVLLGVGVASMGCATPRGGSVAEKRAYVQTMKENTLQDLYARKPESRAKIEQSAGYGVFSNIGFHVVFVGAGNGYGVAVDRSTGKETYMRMMSGTAGLGLGAKDFRAVIVFNDKAALDEFIRKGWEFGAEGEASARVSDKGGTVSKAGSISNPIEIYQFTETGISLQATLGGARFWWDDKLNEN